VNQGDILSERDTFTEVIAAMPCGVMADAIHSVRSNPEWRDFFDRWIYVLKNMYVLENLPKSFQCEAFKKLKEISDVSKLNSTELSRYERAQRDYWDLTNILNSAEKKGKTEEKLSIARNMKVKHYPVEDISEMTGLSIEEINAISLN
jgi:predicted transposase/invertase (TIGR01784 family)